MDWYIDLKNGNDSNTGTSWGQARQSLGSVQSLGATGGDVVKIAKNAIEISISQTGNSNQFDDFLTLSSAIDNIDLMRDYDNSKGYAVGGAIIEQNFAASPLKTLAGFSLSFPLGIIPQTDTKYAYYQFENAIDLQPYEKIQFWITLNDIALNSWSQGSLNFIISADQTGDTISEDLLINLPAKKSTTFPIVIDNSASLPISALSFAIYTTSSTTLLDGSIISIGAVQAIASTNGLQYGDFIKIDSIKSYFKIACIDRVDTSAPILYTIDLTYLYNDINNFPEIQNDSLSLIRPDQIFDFDDYTTPETPLARTLINTGGSSNASRLQYVGGYDTVFDITNGYTCIDTLSSAGCLNITGTPNYLTFDNLLIADSSLPILGGDTAIVADIIFNNSILYRAFLGDDLIPFKKLGLNNVSITNGYIETVIDVTWEFLNSSFYKSVQAPNNHISGIIDLSNSIFIDSVFNFELIGFLSLENGEFHYSTCEITTFSSNGAVYFNDNAFHTSSLSITCEGEILNIDFFNTAYFYFDPKYISFQSVLNAISYQNIDSSISTINNAAIQNSTFVYNGENSPVFNITNCTINDSNFEHNNTDSDSYYLKLIANNSSINKWYNCVFKRVQYIHDAYNTKSSFYTCDFNSNPITLKNIKATTGHKIYLVNTGINTGFETPIHYQLPDSGLIFHKYNKTLNDHRHYFHKGVVTTDTFVHTPGGKSFKMSINDNATIEEDDIIIPLANVAVRGGQPFSMSIYVYSLSATGNLIIKAKQKQYESTQPDLRTVTTTTGSWELLQLNYTPLENGVISFYVTMVTNGNEIFYYDDFTVSQA